MSDESHSLRELNNNNNNNDKMTSTRSPAGLFDIYTIAGGLPSRQFLAGVVHWARKPFLSRRARETRD
jgi:hypothetical protein